jgi:hypothetical protein
MVKALTPNNPNDEPDPAPFKVHLLTRAGRLMRARSEPVRAFATKDEAVRFAGRQLGGPLRGVPQGQKNLARALKGSVQGLTRSWG